MVAPRLLAGSWVQDRDASIGIDRITRPEDSGVLRSCSYAKRRRVVRRAAVATAMSAATLEIASTSIAIRRWIARRAAGSVMRPTTWSARPAAVAAGDATT